MDYHQDWLLFIIVDTQGPNKHRLTLDLSHLNIFDETLILGKTIVREKRCLSLKEILLCELFVLFRFAATHLFY